MSFQLNSLANYKDAISALESLATIAALIIGAIWTWKAFIRNRLKFPSATIEHAITSWRDEDKIFLRVTVRITNTGSVLVQLAEGKTWIEKLTPLPSKLRSTLVAGENLFDNGKHEMNWSLLAKHEFTARDRIEIEPKERDELHFDFAISNQISRVLIYTHLQNQTKARQKKIGWNLSSIYIIPDEHDTTS
jgi:hypothetical protein